MRLAVFDMGTVTCRLAIVDVADDWKLKIYDKRSEIVNLGEGVDMIHLLSEAALQRAQACITGFIQTARAAGAEISVCTLTSFARDAENAGVLLDFLRGQGLKPQIIAGSIEGSLTFLGVAQDFAGTPILVADSGGGSTELSCGQLGAAHELQLDWVHSFDAGARRITERYGLEGAVSPQIYEEALAGTLQLYRDGLRENGKKAEDFSAYETLVAVGGSATTLIALEKRLAPYDPAQVHLASISLEAIDRLGRKLSCLSLEQRAHLPGLQPKRSAVIVGGIVCIRQLLEVLDKSFLTASENDIICGIALEAVKAHEGLASSIGWQPLIGGL